MPKRPSKVGDRFFEAYDDCLVVYEVESVQDGGLALLQVLVTLGYDEVIPREFQGLPLFDSRD